ncbi:MAG TPA: urea carboxylase-associated family protein [Nitrolancea sp.]|nr:urea carboxylase-associated family protein [Nitrolancea sp.]
MLEYDALPISVMVPVGYGRAVRVDPGTLVTVEQTTGYQVVDMIAFRDDDLTEKLSTSHTMASLARMWPVPGQRFLSNTRTPLLELVEDTAGRHDLTMAACDPWRYEIDFGVTGHRNCSDNFLEMFGSLGIERHDLPQPVNLFQHTTYGEDGQIGFLEPSAGPGSHVVLRALVPLLIGFSACPMDLNPPRERQPGDIVVRVAAPESGT